MGDDDPRLRQAVEDGDPPLDVRLVETRTRPVKQERVRFIRKHSGKRDETVPPPSLIRPSPRSRKPTRSLIAGGVGELLVDEI
jgi:hypothetical protein